jgi:hypothetical protein
MRRRPGAPQTDTKSATMNQPLGLTNWQLAHRSLVELRNQTGSDVHISAATMAS